MRDWGKPALVMVTTGIGVLKAGWGDELSTGIQAQTRTVNLLCWGMRLHPPTKWQKLSSKLQCELCNTAKSGGPDEYAHITGSFNTSQMLTTQVPTQRNSSMHHSLESKKDYF